MNTSKNAESQLALDELVEYVARAIWVDEPGQLWDEPQPPPPKINRKRLDPETGCCGGEKKAFDPQLIRRVVDGVIIEEWV